MRSLSILIIFTLVLQAGAALASAKNIAHSRDPNRAKVMQLYQKAGKAFQQAEKKLNSAKYLEDNKKPKLSTRVKLNPSQREAIRKLRFTPHDWDKRIQAYGRRFNK